jgi:hypothetical protein
MLHVACYEDLGNYDYVYPEEPVIMGVKDSLFVAYIGDSLHITPELVHSKAETGNFSFQWEIVIPQELRADVYEGPELKILFGLKPGTYNAMLTVTDHSNEIKYFYNFKIEGRTEFTDGIVVLSDEGGIARLSFIKPDNTVIANLYEGIHGEQLPAKPIQLVPVNVAWQPDARASYWVICGEGDKPGVILDANTMIREKYINDKFFDVPPTLKLGTFKPALSGVTSGIINGKLYLGTISTAPYNPVYGNFSNESAGDYELSPHFIFNEFQYYIGYDVKKKSFVRFESNGAYFGTNYTVIPMGPGFDPANVGVDLIYMQYVNSGASYAFGKDAAGKVFELKFSNALDMFFTNYMKAFTGTDLVKENTKWIASGRGIFYFSSGDKVYRYNPENEEIKPLITSFAGLEVSMLKLDAAGDVLTVGTAGSLYFVDVSTGKNGEIINKIDGIPGATVDAIF